jgi:hypothetical protein
MDTMSRNPIRLTEADIVKIVAKVMNEQAAAEPVAQPQQPEVSNECVRKGQFVKNCNRLYRKAEAGLVIVSPDGNVSICGGNGIYIQLDASQPAYSSRDINNRTEEPKSVTLGAQGGRADANTLIFLVQAANSQVLLSVLNDADCQKNKTVTFLKTVIKNFGTAQAFIQAVKSNPNLRGAENVEEVANTLIKPITGK